MATKKLHWCVIKAQTKEEINEVTRHLMAWPYVRAFRAEEGNSVRVWFSLGEVHDKRKESALFSFASNLIELCFNNMDLKISRWHRDGGNDVTMLGENGFLRPENMVESFYEKFEREIGDRLSEEEGNSFQAMLFNYLNEERRDEMRGILGVLKKDAQEELCCAVLDYIEQGLEIAPEGLVLGALFGYVSRWPLAIGH